MAWSTRQLAELAETTVKAVRYYHSIGLLEEPEREANGYKQYRAVHLVRLLQIRRLSELGVPLSAVESLGRADEDPAATVRVLDAELAESIARLQRIRSELAALLQHGAPADVPPAFAYLSRDFSPRQRALLLIYSTVLSEKSLDVFRQLLIDADETDGEFEALPEDADTAAVESLAQRMAPAVRRAEERHPLSNDLSADAPVGRERAEATMAQAVAELYNPAQWRVLQRVHTLLAAEAEADAG